MSRLRELYRNEIVQKLKKKFGYSSIMQVPKIEKITINMGVGEAAADKKILTNAMMDLMKISGQKPVATLSRKSIATFKIREKMAIGCMVTLRKDKMYEFLDRLITITFPRVRDFRGLSIRSFDGRGNYNLGLKEQIVFPEIEYDKIDVLRGMDINIITSARTNKEAFALLQAFNFPFKEKEAS